MLTLQAQNVGKDTLQGRFQNAFCLKLVFQCESIVLRQNQGKNSVIQKHFPAAEKIFLCEIIVPGTVVRIWHIYQDQILPLKLAAAEIPGWRHERNGQFFIFGRSRFIKMTIDYRQHFFRKNWELQLSQVFYHGKRSNGGSVFRSN